MVLSEAMPFSKTGGLGDVGGALPGALARLGHRVTVVVPRYAGNPAGRVVQSFDRGAWLGCPGLQMLDVDGPDGVVVRFVDCAEYFQREGIYGAGGADYADNHLRFALLARAALETAVRLGDAVDVIHAHDWQAGLAPAYARLRYGRDTGLRRAAAVCTVHNLAYQGVFPREVLPSLDLPWEAFTGEGLEFWGRVSYLKAGVAYADMITTVSPRYAVEIQHAEQGFGFEGILRHRSGSLVGILNGIDTEVWNPASDPFLPMPYSADDLAGKRRARAALIQVAGLTPPPGDSVPIVGMVSRMVDQKGLDIIAAAMPELLQTGAAFVILGTGEAKYQDMWRSLATRHPDRVAVTVGFSEERAHLIEAGADLFLMPSRFEPCGLNQMYSLRYGTVPVVRATGGLDDTVVQVDHRTGEGTGFKFVDYSAGALASTLRYALDWFARPDAWARIQRAGMQLDHSWDASAREYVKVYERAIDARRRQDPGAWA
jgi:starch synthase